MGWKRIYPPTKKALRLDYDLKYERSGWVYYALKRTGLTIRCRKSECEVFIPLVNIGKVG